MTGYNENDPRIVAWLRELIERGHLPVGEIDGRSIADLTPANCAPTMHFFAGIGGWPLAMRRAGLSVGVDWLRRFEQGRISNPSVFAVASVLRSLRFSLETAIREAR